MKKTKDNKCLEESYKALMKKQKYEPLPLLQCAKEDGYFESVLRPDYSNYSTSSVTNNV